MERWVIVYTLLLGDDDYTRAVGHFPSEQACFQWVRNFNDWMEVNGRETEWLGTCMREGEFEREFPRLVLTEHQ